MPTTLNPQLQPTRKQNQNFETTQQWKNQNHNSRQHNTYVKSTFSIDHTLDMFIHPAAARNHIAIGVGGWCGVKRLAGRAPVRELSPRRGRKILEILHLWHANLKILSFLAHEKCQILN